MVEIFVDELRFISFAEIEVQHDAILAVTSILDLTTLLWLAINSLVLEEAIVDKVATHAVPMRNRFINTDPGQWREKVLTLLIDVADQIIHKHPTVLGTCLVIRTHIWLIGEACT